MMYISELMGRSAAGGFVLFTPEMPAGVLQAAGLRPDDSLTASDHLPVVGDFVVRRGD